MRHFFISSLEWLVNLAVILGGIGIAVTAAAMLGNPYAGPLPAIAALIGGFISLVLMAGFIYLQIGIHTNTRRTAEATEALLALQRRNPPG